MVLLLKYLSTVVLLIFIYEITSYIYIYGFTSYIFIYGLLTGTREQAGPEAPHRRGPDFALRKLSQGLLKINSPFCR
jgi:hypothetical protein